jgi:hypothetical protein
MKAPKVAALTTASMTSTLVLPVVEIRTGRPGTVINRVSRDFVDYIARGLGNGLALRPKRWPMGKVFHRNNAFGIWFGKLIFCGVSSTPG